MALTTLDPTTALIIVDLQKGIISIRKVFPRLGETGATQEIIDRLSTRSA